ncbi:MAG: sodium-dependent bicarbonate transport family permease [Gemmatimonadetes bacterium]|nr:sodium-dependent bicarbonate transport family permease [Gemmatimonadota bacterium]
MNDILVNNLLSPIALSFALGVVARLVRSEFSIPKEMYAGISIYLLFALGLHGGVEMAKSSFGDIVLPAVATVAIGLVVPVVCYYALRTLGRFSIADAAGIAAHYGSVSAVTFIAADQFLRGAGVPVEGFMPTLLTLLESPGIHLALAMGAIGIAKEGAAAQAAARTPSATAMGRAGILLDGDHDHDPAADGHALDWKATLHEILTARTMILLVGGLIIGALFGETGWKPIAPFFDTVSPVFKGVLCLFLLEMGLLAGERLGDLRKVGLFLVAFGILFPIITGTLGVLVGSWAGLSTGGAALLGAMAASASYIAAPPAVRVTLPQANPTYSLTLALVITFPFNLLVGIPLYLKIAEQVAR